MVWRISNANKISVFTCFSFVTIALYLVDMWQDRKGINSSVSHVNT